MRYHFRIIDKLTNDIHTDSKDYMVNSGFRDEDNFEGWKTEDEAKFWARDRMKLYGMTEENWNVVISNVFEKTKIAEHVPLTRKEYIKTSKNPWWNRVNKDNT